MNLAVCRVPWTREACVALIAVVGAPSVASGRPVTEDGWEELKRIPDWVASLPQRDGFVRVLDGGQKSNHIGLAYRFDAEGAQRVLHTFRRECVRRLRPALGTGADAVVEAGVQPPTLVRKGYTSWDDGSGGIGSNTVTAWVLWEAPLRPVLEKIAEKDREAAKTALLDPADASVPWQEVATEPEWAAKPQGRPGFLSAAVVEHERRADVVRAYAMVRADEGVHWQLRPRLADVVGARAAVDAIEAAVTWRTLRARATARIGPGWFAWTLWDVPLDRVLDGVPQEHREAVRARMKDPIPPR